jgi:hypothetical protein
MSEAAYLKEQAKRCRMLIDGINDPQTIASLRRMAEDFETRAGLVDATPGPIIPNRPTAPAEGGEST